MIWSLEEIWACSKHFATFLKKRELHQTLQAQCLRTALALLPSGEVDRHAQLKHEASPSTPPWLVLTLGVVESGRPCVCVSIVFSIRCSRILIPLAIRDPAPS